MWNDIIAFRLTATPLGFGVIAFRVVANPFLEVAGHA